MLLYEPGADNRSARFTAKPRSTWPLWQIGSVEFPGVLDESWLNESTPDLGDVAHSRVRSVAALFEVHLFCSAK